MSRGVSNVAALTVAFLVFTAGSAMAEGVSSFYKGKTVTMVTGGGAGGGYDVYLRLFAEHAKPHLPGTPTVVVQNRVGASGINALDYVYNVAAKDGTFLIMPYNVDPIFQLLKPEGRRFDIRKLNWIGNMAQLSNALVVTKAAGVKSIEDVRHKEVIMTSSSPSSQTSIVPLLFNELLGTKFKVVTGYKGTGAMMLSMERGETQGRVGSWYSFKASSPGGLADGSLIVLAQDGLIRQPDLPNVRLYDEITPDADHKKIMRLMSFPVATSRALAVAPGVPADRVAALRAAFKATLADPSFLASAAKRKMEIQAGEHTEIEKVITELFAIPDSLIVRARLLLDPKKEGKN